MADETSSLAANWQELGVANLIDSIARALEPEWVKVSVAETTISRQTIHPPSPSLAHASEAHGNDRSGPVGDSDHGLASFRPPRDYDLAAKATRHVVECLRQGQQISDDDRRRILDALRGKRMFGLMGEVAEALVRVGRDDARVRRQLAQVRIEQGRFEEAHACLESVISDVDAGTEKLEAIGLRGRALKQAYVDGVGVPAEASEVLGRAIQAYLEGYNHDRDKNTWHGINAASLIRRAEQDGVALSELPSAKELAQSILTSLELRRERLDQWDLATAAEAEVVLGNYERASEWVDAYVNHPGADVFELTATTRQFVQVLRLLENPHGAKLVERLRSENLKRSGGGFISQALELASSSASAAGVASTADVVTVPILLRVSDPLWQSNVPDLVELSRIGTIVAARASERSIQALLADPAVVGLESSLPGAVTETTASLVQTGAGKVHADLNEYGDWALVAIIDTGVDLLHEAFSDGAGRSRIVAYWDQYDASGSGPWSGAGGTLYDQAQIQGFVEDPQTLPKKLAADRVSQNGQAPAATHGTHVASIAAGRACGVFGGGVAPNAKLVVVVPKAEFADSDPKSVGYSAAHVQALDFIDRIAKEHDLPVVVNVSQGQNAGAHDGSSLLESAFDQFTENGRKPGRVVVKSAGNERNKGGHARVPLSEGTEAILPWLAQSDRVGALDIVELWLPSRNALSLVLRSPSGEIAQAVSRSKPQVKDTFASGDRYELSYERYANDNAHTRIRVVVVPPPGASIEAGVWALEITPEGAVKDELHAWIEKTCACPATFEEHRDVNMTISIPGTAESVITVGAVEILNQNKRRVGKFSSYGPTRDGRVKPDLVAPGVKITAASSGTGNSAHAACGTSQAAPHITGAVALMLSRNRKLNAVQAKAMLCDHTGATEADCSQGFGLPNFFNVLAAE